MGIENTDLLLKLISKNVKVIAVVDKYENQMSKHESLINKEAEFDFMNNRLIFRELGNLHYGATTSEVQEIKFDGEVYEVITKNTIYSFKEVASNE